MLKAISITAVVANDSLLMKLTSNKLFQQQVIIFIKSDR